ncbi:MAG: acyl carrier protein [bacterium]
MDDILSIINNIRENKADGPLEKLEQSTKLREDCGLDSFDLAELTVRIEKKYNVDVFADGIVNTVGEIVAKIK